MRSYRSILAVGCLCVGLTSVAQASTKSKAVTPEVLEAIKGQLDRSMKRLAIPGAPPLYYIAFKVTEVKVNDVAATLGSTVVKRDRHFVSLEAHVHVGSPKLDNSNFIIPNARSLDGVASFPLPLEATPRIARRAAWLTIDSAYKEAIAQLQAKLQQRNSSGIAASSRPPSYTVEPKRVDNKHKEVPALETLAALEKRAQTVSRSLRGASHLRHSRVALTSFLEHRWYMNSEGTSVHDTRRVSGVVLSAAGQAPDGEELSSYATHYGRTGADLPADAALIADAKKLSGHIAALKKAPRLAGYTGPVLFEGEASADILRHTLARHFGGTPVPEGLEVSEAKRYGGALAARVNKGRILHKNVTIVDDPTRKQFNGKVLIGGYRYDDEGVDGKKVLVVKNGQLKELLGSRTPSTANQKSNGHARRAPLGGNYHGSPTNMLVTTRGGVSNAKLRAKLLAAAREEGNDFGIIIRKLDDAAITGSPELSRRELITLINGTDTNAPPPPLLIYKVYLNGKEELVRGAVLEPVESSDWKRLIATGRKSTVKNYLNSGRHNLLEKIDISEEGFVPSGGVESAIASPAFLFREVSLTPAAASRRALPVVPRPR